MRVLLTATVACAALCGAAEAATITPQKLLQDIDRARSTIDIFVPEGLSSAGLERALARASSERGVRVRVVAPQGVRAWPSSRINNLILAGANLRDLSQSSAWLYEIRLNAAAKGFVVIDNRLAYVGNVGEGFDDLKQSHTQAGALKSWVDSVARSRPVSLRTIEQDVIKAVRGR